MRVGKLFGGLDPPPGRSSHFSSSHQCSLHAQAAQSRGALCLPTVGVCDPSIYPAAQRRGQTVADLAAHDCMECGEGGAVGEALELSWAASRFDDAGNHLLCWNFLSWVLVFGESKGDWRALA